MNRTQARIALGIGVAATGIMFGFLVGASETPLAGTVVSTAFVSAIGLISVLVANKDAPDLAAAPQGGVQQPPPVNHGRDTKRTTEAIFLLGIILLMFSGGFLGGVFWGADARNASENIEPHVAIPWQSTTAPSTPGDAWYWLTFSHDAGSMGLSDEEIQRIYALHFETHGPNIGKAKSAMPTTNVSWPSLQSAPTDGGVGTVNHAASGGGFTMIKQFRGHGGPVLAPNK
jgi:hypothetical protein